MSGDFEVRGLEDLAKLTHALREAGDGGKGLKRELRAGLNRETKVVRAEMKAAIEPALPHRGGLAADVLASTRFGTSIGSSANPSVSIRARGKRSIRHMNDTGTFRHPVFGRRDTWVTQYAPRLPRFLDKPFEASRPHVQYAVTQAIARVQLKIHGSI